MFDTSPTIASLAKALAAAQGEVEGAVKGKANPAFRSKYADLAAVWELVGAAREDEQLVWAAHEQQRARKPQHHQHHQAERQAGCAEHTLQGDPLCPL